MRPALSECAQWGRVRHAANQFLLLNNNNYYYSTTNRYDHRNYFPLACLCSNFIL